MCQIFPNLPNVMENVSYLQRLSVSLWMFNVHGILMTGVNDTQPGSNRNKTKSSRHGSCPLFYDFSRKWPALYKMVNGKWYIVRLPYAGVDLAVHRLQLQIKSYIIQVRANCM